MPGDIVNAIRSAWRYHRDRRGIFTSNIAEAGGFLKTSPELPAPDIQLHFCIGILENHGRRLHAARGFSTHVCVLRPKSAGTLTLASRDPLAAPRIDPGFYTHPDDIDVMVKGFRIARGISQSPMLDPHRGKEMFTAGIATDDEIRAVLRNRSDTIYHPVGTCRMGVDDGAVVDPQLRVRGVSGIARRRCVGHADVDRRQHQRADDHDRRAGERSHQEWGMSAATLPPIADWRYDPPDRGDVITIPRHLGGVPAVPHRAHRGAPDFAAVGANGGVRSFGSQ